MSAKTKSELESDLFEACRYGTFTIADVRHLIEDLRVDPNARDPAGRTPLHVALANRNEAAAHLLLNWDADREAVDGDGATPLHVAAARGCLSVVEELLESEVGINPRDSHGRTPLHLACLRSEWSAAVMLRKAGADPDALDSDVPPATPRDCAERGPYPDPVGRCSEEDADYAIENILL
jgi:ankyrin repeat protein